MGKKSKIKKQKLMWKSLAYKKLGGYAEDLFRNFKY